MIKDFVSHKKFFIRTKKGKKRANLFPSPISSNFLIGLNKEIGTVVKTNRRIIDTEVRNKSHSWE